MKKRLLLLLLVCALTLSGCSLVVKDPVVDMGRTVVSVNGQTVNKAEMMDAYSAEYGYQQQMQQYMQMFGQQPRQINPQEVLESAKNSVIRRLVVTQKAAELKLGELTDAEKEDYEKKVEEAYKGLLDQVKTQFFADTKLEGEELQKLLVDKADELGRTRELVAKGVLDSFLSDKLQQLTIKDVAVPEEDVRADYDQKVKENQEKFDATPDLYGQQVNSRATVYYAPKGYRFVKQILVKFTEEDQKLIEPKQTQEQAARSMLDQAKAAVTANAEALKAENLSEDQKKALTEKATELEKAQTQAQEDFDTATKALAEARDAGYANIKEKAQGLYERAKTEDFDALAKEFNEDKGMPEQGYAIREGFASFDAAFVTPAMALTEPGQVAEPSPGQYGYYIVQYAAPIQDGPVAYDSVHDSLHQGLLNTKQQGHWEAEVKRWTEEAKVESFMDRMTD